MGFPFQNLRFTSIARLHLKEVISRVSAHADSNPDDSLLIRINGSEMLLTGLEATEEGYLVFVGIHPETKKESLAIQSSGSVNFSLESLPDVTDTAARKIGFRQPEEPS